MSPELAFRVASSIIVLIFILLCICFDLAYFGSPHTQKNRIVLFAFMSLFCSLQLSLAILPFYQNKEKINLVLFLLYNRFLVLFEVSHCPWLH
jgi:hypothetical protein